jgi:adenosylcobalamin-dependent ribonucleoside-triphosphate reductase
MAEEVTVQSSFFTPKKIDKITPFYLSDDFIKTYEHKKVDWSPIGEFTYLRTYARWIEGNKRRKAKWFECVRRVVEGCFDIQKKHCHINKVPWNNVKAQNSAKIMYDLIFRMKFLPPGRGLWMMGTEYVTKHGSISLQNCSFVSTKNLLNDPVGPFKFLMDVSMLGVGCGFDTIGRDKLIIKKPTYINEVAIIPDSREGWVETLSILLSGFFIGTEIPKFDFSLIRQKGSPIKGFGGESSGPGPLIEMLEDIDKLLTKKIGLMLSSVDIIDICDMIGKCVVSGNVRRSALLALGDSNDIEFLKMKDYNLHPKECDSHRWASNNSIKAIVGQDYNSIAELIAKNGEPGVVWLDNMKKYGRMKDPENNLDYKVDGCNPCVEIGLENMELCNLCESFPSRHESYEEYQLTLKYAYLYAKTVTLVPTHYEQTNAVMLRNRRIGMSQSGIIDAFAKHGRKNILDWCDKGYSYLKELDAIYSDWLCIPKSIKISSVKPSGTVSILADVSPGIHYPHSEYYIRRVTISSDSPLVKIMKDAGYNIIKSTTDKTAMLVEFPIHTKYFVKGKNDVTMWEQLLNAADYQKFWSDNQVSITVTFKKEEARDIANALSIFDSKLKGVSMLPLKDHGYKHPPYEEITADQFEEMASKIKQPDYSLLTSGEAIGEKYCDSDKCTI